MPFFTVWDTTKSYPDAVLNSGVESATGDKPIGLQANLAWLQEVTDAKPTYDPSTQKLQYNSAGVIAFDANDPQLGTRTFTWTAVALTDAELDRISRDSYLESEAVAVGAIVKNWRDNPQASRTADDIARVGEFIAVRDGLDLQAPQV